VAASASRRAYPPVLADIWTLAVSPQPSTAATRQILIRHTSQHHIIHCTFTIPTPPNAWRLSFHLGGLLSAQQYCLSRSLHASCHLNSHLSAHCYPVLLASFLSAGFFNDYTHYYISRPACVGRVVILLAVPYHTSRISRVFDVRARDAPPSMPVVFPLLVPLSCLFRWSLPGRETMHAWKAVTTWIIDILSRCCARAMKCSGVRLYRCLSFCWVGWGHLLRLGNRGASAAQVGFLGSPRK